MLAVFSMNTSKLSQPQPGDSAQWVTGDETGLTSQLISTPSLSTQPMKGCTTPPRYAPPTPYNQLCGLFYVHKNQNSERAVRRGPWFFVLIRERLECLTIYRCYNKDSTFSSVILSPWVLVRLGFGPATISVREIFLPGRAVNHLPRKISQVSQFLTKDSKRNEGHIATT